MIRIGLLLMVLSMIGGSGVVGLGTIEIVVLLLVFLTGVALIAQGVTKRFGVRAPDRVSQ